MAGPLGLAAAVHVRALRQPARARLPGDPDSYPGRDDVIAYLTDYAQRFELPVEFNSRVQAVRARDGGGFVVELADRPYEADQVVVATGPFQVPFTPPVAAGLGPEVVQLHSTRYRSPDDLPTGTVLVVGGGNTGYQISEELAQSRQVHLAIGARQMPLPQRILGRDLFRYLHATGLMYKTVDSRLAQRLKDKETLIGSSPRAARKLGIQLRPRATAAQGRSVTFADGSELAVDGVVWATGFRLDHSFVQLPVFDERGAVRTGAASPTSPACTSSACSGSTPAARRCWAGSRTTRSSSPNASTRSLKAARHRRPSWPPKRVRDDRRRTERPHEPAAAHAAGRVQLSRRPVAGAARTRARGPAARGHVGGQRAADREVFTAVAREAALLLGAQRGTLLRVVSPQWAEVVASWSDGRAPALPVGHLRAIEEGRGLLGQMLQTARPVRIEDFDEVGGVVAALMRELGFRLRVWEVRSSSAAVSGAP